MSNQELNEAFEGIPLVDITGPDGTVFHFRFGAMIPYAGEEYAVLLEMELDENGEEQVLITKVEKAEDAPRYPVEEELTSEICPLCGHRLVVKIGRFGPFLACPGYPDCKNAKPLIVNTGARCPVCGGEIIERKSKKGHVFFGCGSWPKCNFMSWDPPAGENCSDCGKALFKKKTGISFITYVNNLRVAKACDLLASTSLSASEICYDCGFNNKSNFIRIFTKRKNMTPIEYRNHITQLLIKY